MSSPLPAAVIVVGSINEDLVFDGIAALPLPGETVSSGRVRSFPGGKGGNQATAARRLGARTLLVGAVGADEAGRQAIAQLSADDVEVALVREREAATGRAVVAIDSKGENLIVVAPGANGLVDAEDCLEAARLLEGHRVVLLASLEIPQETVARWAGFAHDQGWTVVVNPAPAPHGGLSIDLLRHIDVLTPNESEFESLAGGQAEVFFDAGVGALVQTMGARGARIFRPASTVVDVPAFAADAVDSTGAGDAFSGALAAALASGIDLDDAARFAAAAGSLATRATGARSSLATVDEVERLLEQP